MAKESAVLKQSLKHSAGKQCNLVVANGVILVVVVVCRHPPPLLSFFIVLVVLQAEAFARHGQGLDDDAASSMAQKVGQRG